MGEQKVGPTVICPQCSGKMLDGILGTGETTFQCNDCKIAFIPLYKTWRAYTWSDENKTYKHIYDAKMQGGF